MQIYSNQTVFKLSELLISAETKARDQTNVIYMPE